jgi:hypothetical protein
MTAADQPSSRRVDWLAAGLLALPAVTSCVLLAHHPVLRLRHGATDVANGLRAVASMDRLVHGGLMATFALQALGFWLFSARLGWRRPSVAAGFMAYSAGVLLMTIPATLDGFVAPDLAAACSAAPGGCAGGQVDSLRLVALLIQDFSKVALMAISVGTFAWAFALLTGGAGARRGAGLVGLACAVVPAWTLLFSNLYLTPANLVGAFAPTLLWSLVVAVLMMMESQPDVRSGNGVQAGARAAEPRSAHSF